MMRDSFLVTWLGLRRCLGTSFVLYELVYLPTCTLYKRLKCSSRKLTSTAFVTTISGQEEVPRKHLTSRSNSYLITVSRLVFAFIGL